MTNVCSILGEWGSTTRRGRGTSSKRRCRATGRDATGAPPGSPSWNAGGDGPAWSRKRQPFEAPADLAPTDRHGGGAVRRAALPLQLLVPRRRLASRGAGRRGGPARPRGAGDHRPRRLLRRRPLRRGGPGRRPADRVRHRAHARRTGLDRLGADRRSTRPTRVTQVATGQVPDSPRPRPARRPPAGARRRARPATPALPGRSASATWRGRRARRSSRFADLADAIAGHGWVLTGAARARCRRRCVDRRSGGRPPRAAAADRARSGATACWSSCGTTATRSTRPATTRSPSSPHATDVDLRRHQQRALRHARAAPAGHGARRGAGPAQPRRARPVAAGGGRRPPALGRRAGPPVRAATPAWSSGPPRSAGPRRSTSSLVAPNLPPFPCPHGPTAMLTEMQYLRQLVEEGGRRRYGERPAAHEDLSLRARAWKTIDHELDVIEQLGFPGYFLVVWDIVEFCRRSEHLLPGPGQRGQLGGLLRARHHQRRRRVARPAVRAVPVARARRPARHRHRHRERPPRGGHPVRLRTLRPPPHRPGRQRHHLPGPVGGARHGQGARLRAGPAGRLVASRSTRGATSPTTAEPARLHDIPAAGARARGRDRGRAAPPRHPLRRHGDLRPAGDRGVPGRVGPDGQAQRAAVGQGRLRRGRAGEVRPARPRACSSALHYAVDLDPRAPRLRGRPGHHPAGGRRLRDAVPGRHGRRVPDRVAGADGHAAAAASRARSTTSWSRWR